MLLKEPSAVLARPQPRSFAALMELYEANYIRLRRLCPGLSSIAHRAVSSVPGALDLHLEILERRRYTTTLLLTYYFRCEDGPPRANPNLVVRLYHDARQAEVLSGSCRRSRREIRVQELPWDSALACKWRLNRFLFKWLGYCLHQGHRFPEPAGAD